MAGLLLASSVAVGCSPTYAPGYQEAFARGLRAEHAGRWSEAISAFDEAADLGDRYKDRDEARLRVAAAYEAQGELHRALETYAKVEAESGGRYQGVRAAFDGARVTRSLLGPEEGEKATLAAVRKYPTSGYVRHAIKRLAQDHEDRDGAEGALRWLAPIEAELRSTEAGEAISYEYASLLGRAGKTEASLAALLELARSHPYPHGSLTDDAYYVASLHLEALGRPKEAVSVLQEMLAPREVPYGGSSLDRPRFPEAVYRIAVLYRDPLADRAEAKRWFQKMIDEHFDSRLTDDAFWALARMQKAEGDAPSTCKTLRALQEQKPDSRYARCTAFLCETLPAPAGAHPCTSSIIESLGADADAYWEGRPSLDPDGPSATSR